MTMKIIISIMLAALVANAEVITYKKEFDLVRVAYPAKSPQFECMTKVDISEGLVDNYVCKINRIMVYNKDSMWIGDLAENIEPFYSYRYLTYDNHNKYTGKGAFVQIEYETPTLNATQAFLDVLDTLDMLDTIQDEEWAVSCPKGMTGYIDDSTYYCKDAFDCDDGMYAIDSLNCSALPEHAHRKKTTGYYCDTGYVQVNYACEEKVICGPDDIYDKDVNRCYEHPNNAHWTNNFFDWECDTGYVQVNYACEEKVTCDSSSRYYDLENKCVTLPFFAHWRDSVSSDWTCNDGYVIDTDGYCVEKATCSSKQLYNKSLNTCVDPRPHSRWIDDAGHYVCDVGYVIDTDGYCVKKATCSSKQLYNKTLNTCVDPRPHSRWIDDAGHYVCDVGYVIGTDGYCAKKAQCSDSRYNSANNSCYEKPEHSHWTYTTGEEWSCDKGYYATIYGDCAEINPTHFSDYIKLFNSLTVIIGGIFVTDYTYEENLLLNLALEYNIGIGFGTDDFKVRPNAIIGLLANVYEYYLYDSDYSYYYSDPETMYSTAFVVGIGVGVDVWHFTIDYNYLYAYREALTNVEFYPTLHQFKVGYSFNKHWNVNIATIYPLIKNTTELMEYEGIIYNFGVTYVF